MDVVLTSSCLHVEGVFLENADCELKRSQYWHNMCVEASTMQPTKTLISPNSKIMLILADGNRSSLNHK